MKAFTLAVVLSLLFSVGFASFGAETSPKPEKGKEAAQANQDKAKRPSEELMAKARAIIEEALAVQVDSDSNDGYFASAMENWQAMPALQKAMESLARLDADSAIDTARRIKDVETRVRALSAIATTMAKENPSRAREIAGEAIKLTVEKKVVHTNLMMKTSTPIFPDLAGSLVAVAPSIVLEAAKNLHDEQLRTQSLLCIVRGLVQADPDRALGVSELIREPGLREEALECIAQGLAKRNPDKALKVAGLIRDPGNRIITLMHLAVAWAKTDPKRSRRTAEEALRMARSIKKKGAREEGLLRAACALAPINLKQALKVAYMIKDRNTRYGTLMEIACLLEETDPESALKAAHGIEPESFRDSRLQAIVEVLAKTNAEKALEVSQSIRDKASRETSIGYIAQVVAEIDADRAVAIAESLRNKDAFRYALALRDVARVIGKRDPERGLALAQTITNTSEREDALGEAAVGFVRAGPKQSLDRALGIVKHISDDLRREVALHGIVEALVNEDPLKALEISQAAAQDTGNYGWSYSHLMMIAPALAKKDIDRSLEVARSIVFPFDRTKVLLQLVPIILQREGG